MWGGEDLMRCKEGLSPFFGRANFGGLSPLKNPRDSRDPL